MAVPQLLLQCMGLHFFLVEGRSLPASDQERKSLLVLSLVKQSFCSSTVLSVYEAFWYIKGGGLKVSIGLVQQLVLEYRASLTVTM